MNLLNMYLSYTSEHEAQEILHKWSIIWATSTVLSGKCWTTLGGSPLKSNLYVMFLGPPGTRKSAAMNCIGEVMEPIFEAPEITQTSDDFTYASFMLEFTNSKQSVIINEVPYNYMSMSLMVDEVDSFLDFNDDKLRALLLNGFDGLKRRNKSTKHSGVDHLKNMSLNMLTASTDFNKTKEFAFYASKGLTSRFILIPVETKRFHKQDSHFPGELKEKIQKRLFSLINIIGLIPYSTSGEEAFGEWYQKQPLGEDKRVPPLMQHYASRRPTYLRKLSLIIWAWDYLEDYTIEKKITEKQVIEALKLLVEIESYLLKAYGASGRAKSIEDIVDLDSFFKSNKGKWIKRTEVFTRFKKEIDSQEIKKLLIDMCTETKDLKVRIKFSNEEYTWIGEG